MRFLNLILLSAVFVTAALQVKAAAIDPRLMSFARGSGGPQVRVIALMKYETSRLAVPQRYNYQAVYKYLYTQTKYSWDLVRPQIETRTNNVRVLKIHWINNSLVLDVTPQGLKDLAQIPQVEKIYFNGPIYYEKPVKRSAPFAFRFSRDTQGGPKYPYDLIDMGVDKLMEQRPDILGTGVRIGLVDTGVDGKHPALAGKVALFFDAATNEIKEPYDADTHGTHTSGTLLGGDRQNAVFGMAPGARLIASAALSDYADMLKAMEFMIDPDHNPQTPDAPRLVSNSWNCMGAPDLELFYRAISAWEAAGILPVFSAGNAGPKPQSITSPHEHPDAFAVAATNQLGKVADFSSRGPGVFKGQKTLKPDLAAPGVDIVSSVPGGGMASMSGTSMACPHVGGLAALIYQVNPQLNPVQMREVILRNLNFVDDSGNPTSSAVWTAKYGYGKANALAAVRMAAGMNRFARNQWTSFQPEKLFQLADLSTPVEWVQQRILSLDKAQPAMNLVQAYPTSSTNWVQLR